MDINNNENATNEETSSFSIMSPSICLSDNPDLDALYNFLYGNSISKLDSYEAKDVTEKLEDEEETKDHQNKCNGKRQHSMEDRAMMEKRRRQVIRDKVNVLATMTPNCTKSDIASKVESIVAYIKSLKYQTDMMYMAYAESASYMSTFYGQHAPPYMPPYTTPWGYYVPGNQMMPQQNMNFLPQYNQEHHDTAPRDQTKP